MNDDQRRFIQIQQPLESHFLAPTTLQFDWDVSFTPQAKRIGRPRRALWLHPTKGWRGMVRHPKRGRARPIRQALLEGMSR